ncbi:MAG: T9SS type A sorting domain-containing protein, partial [FCB group bacterium]
KNENQFGYINFYPNPVSDKIILNDIRFAGEKYIIFDADGKIADEGMIKYDNIFVTNLYQGLYYLKMGNEVIKFIKK